MLIAMSGPSGIGKGFVKERLLAKYPFIQEPVWLTTRPLRPNERNRKSVTAAEFSELANDGRLALIREIYGHRYALAQESLLPCSQIVLTEIHPDNVREALALNSDIFIIGLVTTDLSLLYERLTIIRKTESSEEILRRMQAAQREMAVIEENRALFQLVLEITRAAENSVFDAVHMVLEPYLNIKGA